MDEDRRSRVAGGRAGCWPHPRLTRLVRRSPPWSRGRRSRACGGPLPSPATNERSAITRVLYDTGEHVHVSGALDRGSARALLELCLRGTAGPSRLLFLDLGEVTHMDAEGLAALVAVSERRGEDLAIIVGPVCARVIDDHAMRDALPIIEG
jgi:hypothetical protein